MAVSRKAKPMTALEADWAPWENMIFTGDHLTPGDAARSLGYGGSSAFKRADKIRHAEILDRWAHDRDERDQEWSRDRLVELAERSMQAVPVLDKDGRETGEYRFDGNVAVRSVELVAKMAGAFHDPLEITGPDGAPLEVLNPDVAAAIDRFTALADAAIRSAARTRTIEAAQPALTGGES